MNDFHMLKNKNVLVTGGTGFTGNNLLRKLFDLGANIHLIVRSPEKLESDIRKHSKIFQGDVYDPEVVNQATVGIHYIFHLAACFREPGAENTEYWNVHVKSTQLLAKAAMNEDNFVRFIHISTIGVHGHIANPPASEEYPYNPDDIYQVTKLKGEEWIRDFSSRTGLPLVVIRPASIMGPTDRRLVKLFKSARYGFFPQLDGHNTKFHLIHVEDLNDCIILSSHHPNALGEVFICGNKESTSFEEILTQVGEIVGKNVKFISIPGKPLFMITDFVEWISKKLEIHPIIYRRRLATFTKDRSFDTSKVRKVLNFECKYDNKKGIEDTAKRYLEKGWI